MVTDCGEDCGAVVEEEAGGAGDGVLGWIQEGQTLERGY
jgi:hypothetical protein